ncbi:hypothetical protein WA026_022899 [Henosepilachna vigintioctopunctata]|uniref:Uncharacterized protein n=1 Tax=Henosepilachna vigintioctopunctata TaxID=420089 RepID=A0AAW1TT42_9CUCU
MKILSLSTGYKERKKLLNSLRNKRGNYLNSNEVTKPVRKGALKSNYLPSSFCLGFYSARNLWRHRKYTNKIENPKNAQADTEIFFIRHLIIDLHLRAHVFPRMRADEISQIAKKNQLICAFASRYIKTKRSAALLFVCI